MSSSKTNSEAALRVSFQIVDPKYSDARICRENGWRIGTRLVGDEGYGPTVIELTAIGEEKIMAKAISHNGVPEESPYEGSWTLMCREWREVGNAG